MISSEQCQGSIDIIWFHDKIPGKTKKDKTDPNNKVKAFMSGNRKCGNFWITASMLATTGGIELLVKRTRLYLNFGNLGSVLIKINLAESWKI